MKKQQAANEFYDKITDHLIKNIKEGASSWIKAWSGGRDFIFQPHNPTTKRGYNGSNLLWLSLLSAERGYEDSRWGTFKNIKDQNGSVCRGQKGTKILFFSPIKKTDDNGEEKLIFIQKVYTVFNYSQCDGMPEAEIVEREEPELNPVAMSYIKNEGVELRFGGNRASYNPGKDLIKMPHQDSFTSEQEFTSTLFHEIAHSTGHQDRLNRKGFANEVQFGSHEYSFEELVAEFTAVFVNIKLGLTEMNGATTMNSAAYLRSWMKVLNNNPKWAAKAAQKAQKACEFIIAKSQTESAAA